MKHNIKITAILIIMFIATQLIGLFVISIYQNPLKPLPFLMQPPEAVTYSSSIISILIAFVIAIALFFVLTRIKADKIIKFWFFIVTAIAIGLTLKAIYLFNLSDIIIKVNIPYLDSIIPEFSIFSLVIFFAIAIPLAFIKIFKRNIIVHNITELLIYPGIAAVFVPLLNIFGIIILLILISIYDIWAVWHSGFMQKMAKYQINTLKFFTGFFIPYANKKEKEKIITIKEKYKNKSEKFLENKLKRSKIKINLAILGGGDVIFPIITAGVIFKFFGLLPALVIILFASLALLWLFVFAKKGKFYPAMPFLTTGLFIGMIVDWILIAANVL